LSSQVVERHALTAHLKFCFAALQQPQVIYALVRE
jgi:hypothetical protein